MFKNFIYSQLLKPLFCPRTVKQKLSNLRIDFFYRSIISPFAKKLFLLPFSSHCSTQNISFGDCGTSSNLHNQAPVFTELCLLQSTSFYLMNQNNIHHVIMLPNLKPRIRNRIISCSHVNQISFDSFSSDLN